MMLPFRQAFFTLSVCLVSTAAMATDFCEFERPPEGFPFAPHPSGHECHQFYDMGNYPPAPTAETETKAATGSIARTYLFANAEESSFSVNLCGMGEVLATSNREDPFVTFVELDFDTIVDSLGLRPEPGHRLVLTAVRKEISTSKFKLQADWYRLPKTVALIGSGGDPEEMTLLQPSEILGEFQESCFDEDQWIQFSVGAKSVTVQTGSGKARSFNVDPRLSSLALLRPKKLHAGGLISEFARPLIFALNWRGVGLSAPIE